MKKTEVSTAFDDLTVTLSQLAEGIVKLGGKADTIDQTKNIHEIATEVKARIQYLFAAVSKKYGSSFPLVLAPPDRASIKKELSKFAEEAPKDIISDLSSLLFQSAHDITHELLPSLKAVGQFVEMESSNKDASSSNTHGFEAHASELSRTLSSIYAHAEKILLELDMIDNALEQK